MSAQTQLGAAETDVNKQFAQAKNQAEAQYAQQVQSYMQNEQNRLNDIIAQQGENVMGAEYDAGMDADLSQYGSGSERCRLRVYRNWRFCSFVGAQDIKILCE